MDRFLVVLTPLPRGWLASAPEVPGIGAEGPTRAIVLHKVRASLAEVLARSQQLGARPPAPASLHYVDLSDALPRPLPALPAPQVEVPAALKQRLRALGFSIVELGGGASALYADREATDVFIRHTDGPWAPRTLDSPVIVEETVRGLREVGSPLEDDIDTAEFSGYTLREVLEALEDPDDEYETIEMRLANRGRPGAANGEARSQ